MKCSCCGKSEFKLSTYINPETGETHFRCLHCQGMDTSEKITDLKELEEYLNLVEDTVQKCEEIITLMGADAQDNSELSRNPFALTPLSIYEGLQAHLAHLKSKRMAMIAEKDTIEHLQDELKRAVEAEDYDLSAALRDQIAEMKKYEQA